MGHKGTPPQERLASHGVDVASSGCWPSFRRRLYRRTLVPWALAVLPCADAASDLGRLSAQEPAVVTVLPNDRDVLVELYHATGGPDWDHSFLWLTDQPVDYWYGVSVDSTGRVERLDLRDNDLRGPIPPEIGKLRALTFLELSGNDLDGSIPSEIGNLAALNWLDLGDNDLSGPIPSEIGNLARLWILNLEDNELNGSIPPEIGNLAGLAELHLASSGLGGPIPPEIGNLASLRVLDLTSPRWTGAIPPEMANLVALRTLKLFGGPRLCVPNSPRLLRWAAELTNLTVAFSAPPRCEGGM